MLNFPNAKINLGLNIIEKRTDGFHNIESCFYPVLWQDVLEIIEHTHTEFVSSGIAIPGNPSENLCIKAYRLLQQDYNIPNVKIRLHKNIPIGAGLGGGSADGSFTLKLLNDKFQLGASCEALEKYAAKLGSDCPFFIKNQPTLVKGRGDVFTETTVDVRGKFIVLINPQIHISTQEAYSGIVPHKPQISVEEILKLPLRQWKDNLKNDFEESIFQKYPNISQIKQDLYSEGAIYASMTGSGATVYGIFDSEINIQNLKKHDYIVWKGFLA